MKGLSDVREFIEKSGIEAEILELAPESTRTSASAASAIGCSVAEISKSIVFGCTMGTVDVSMDRTVIVVLSGDMLVDKDRLQKEMECISARKLTTAEVRNRTGYVVGGVPPFPHNDDIIVLADRSIFRFIASWAAAGETYAVMRIRPELLSEKLGYRIADVSIRAVDRPA
ncbi:MAG: YbaK/EbsC family protein [Candidatus Thermoplasmatota archaeon]|nr:YbaK/EbsC family protein [Candidatus Thermoplasmatota archaeon]